MTFTVPTGVIGSDTDNFVAFPAGVVIRCAGSEDGRSSISSSPQLVDDDCFRFGGVAWNLFDKTFECVDFAHIFLMVICFDFVC